MQFYKGLSSTFLWNNGKHGFILTNNTFSCQYVQYIFSIEFTTANYKNNDNNFLGCFPYYEGVGQHQSKTFQT